MTRWLLCLALSGLAGCTGCPTDVPCAGTGTWRLSIPEASQMTIDGRTAACGQGLEFDGFRLDCANEELWLDTSGARTPDTTLLAITFDAETEPWSATLDATWTSERFRSGKCAVNCPVFVGGLVLEGDDS